MKYDFHAKFMGKVLSNRITEYLITALGKKRANELKSLAKREYKSMVLRSSDIGAKENMNYTAFLTGAMLFSFQKVSNGQITEKIFGEAVDYLAHWPMLLKTYAKTPEFSESEINKRKLGAERSQKEKYPHDWVFTFAQNGADEHLITYTRCGICELAKSENCLPFAKYICKMDYITYEKKGAVLKRTKTIADGFDLCDFVLTKK